MADVSAYERASWPYWTSRGESAISTPAMNPAVFPAIRSAIAPVKSAQVAPSAAEGNRKWVSVHGRVANGLTAQKYSGKCLFRNESATSSEHGKFARQRVKTSSYQKRFVGQTVDARCEGNQCYRQENKERWDRDRRPPRELATIISEELLLQPTQPGPIQASIPFRTV